MFHLKVIYYVQSLLVHWQVLSRSAVNINYKNKLEGCVIMFKYIQLKV